MLLAIKVFEPDIFTAMEVSHVLFPKHISAKPTIL